MYLLPPALHCTFSLSFPNFPNLIEVWKGRGRERGREEQFDEMLSAIFSLPPFPHSFTHSPHVRICSPTIESLLHRVHCRTSHRRGIMIILITAKPNVKITQTCQKSQKLGFVNTIGGVVSHNLAFDFFDLSVHPLGLAIWIKYKFVS